jgi:hypothetical protein
MTKTRVYKKKQPVPKRSFFARLFSFGKKGSTPDTSSEETKPQKTVHRETTHNTSPAQKKTGKLQLLKAILSGFAVLLFFLFCTALYLATIKGTPGNPDAKQIRAQDSATKPFELSPERGRFAHTVAFAEQGSFSLSQDLADAVYPDVGYVDGRFYSFFAPGIAILAVPLYKLGSQYNLAQVASFSLITLFALGNLAVLYRIGREMFKVSIPAALVAPLIFAFGSTSWSYATTLYQHHLTTFFVLSAFYAVWRYAKRTRSGMFWGAYVWFSYAAAFLVDYPNLQSRFPSSDSVLKLPSDRHFF